MVVEIGVISLGGIKIMSAWNDEQFPWAILFAGSE